jgi:hypothetical protein
MSPTSLHTARTDSPIDLPRRAMFKLPDAAAVQIECRSGSLWITLDGDTRDFIVEAGERFSTESHRQAIVYALQAAVVVVEPHRPPSPARAVVLDRARSAAPGRTLWPAAQQPVAVR